MAIDMADVIHQLIQDRGMSLDLILKTVEETLLSAYKRRFNNADNAEVRISDDYEVSLFAKKEIVDGVYNPAIEIDLEEAQELDPEAEIGDELLIELDPRDFDRVSVRSARLTARQSIREIQKDSLFAEYKSLKNETVSGYYQRERNGTIYVDLGRVEGILPKKNQSPREIGLFGSDEKHINKITALISDVRKTDTGLQILLSRTDPKFVEAIFSREVPEIYDETVKIFNSVRIPGYRTKIAVTSTKEDVDAVGACVGLRGARILAVIKELNGEKIDVLKYDIDPCRYIKNALSPADVKEGKVVILNEARKEAIAVVTDDQLALAIGKQGQNVRLANQLTGWLIDVKTEAQFAELGISAERKQAISRLFGGDKEPVEDYAVEVIEKVSQLPGVDADVVKVLQENDLDDIPLFVEKSDEDLIALGNITQEQIALLHKLIDDSVEVKVVEEEAAEEETPAEAEAAASDTEAAQDGETAASPAESAEAAGAVSAEEEQDEYLCPECGAKITLDMAVCPACGAELSFEYEEE